MEISTNLQLTTKPGLGGEVLELIKSNIHDTRAYDGNLAQYIVSDVEDSDKIEGFGRWESKEKFEAYFQWRIDTGFIEKLSAYLVAEPTMRIHKVEGVY
mgnify:FL=1